ncbi:hypothetical protein [Corallococcus sp. AS-1-6]|uniref:hypothetical protein n=1 Tax=Corallococcus sp. AS-1-6 TaxID=2874599 RepID=UPI001CBE72F2|nr:hypothetical protein [Corallococcus sp. AS-1-6]MBZ4371668.1 hypothetical protein [Corallococcus sp. AS-1-6]
MTSSDRGMPGRRRRIAVASLTGLAVLAGATLLGVEAWYQGRFETPLRDGGEPVHRPDAGVTVEDPASGMSSLASSVAWIPWAPGRLARSHLARGVLASTLGDLTALYENTTKHPAPLHGQAGISTP